jgi:hypothetical protein
MKSNRKLPPKAIPVPRKPEIPNAASVAIGRKVLEIKRISGEGEMTEINLALFRHLK